MKKWIMPIIIVGIVIIILIVIGVAVFLSRCNVYYVSPEFYETLLGEGDPETFCQTKGKGTWLQGEYTYATVNSSGGLVLLLTDKTVQEWKNSIYELQILQRALSSERDIGIEPFVELFNPFILIDIR